MTAHHYGVPGVTPAVRAGDETATAVLPSTVKASVRTHPVFSPVELDNEQWRAVVNFEGWYEVSDLGRVRSVDRIIECRDGKRQRHPGTVLKPTEGRQRKDIYLRVSFSTNATKSHFRVQHLVADAFMSPRPLGMVLCHEDGNGFNNRLSNLRWDTAEHNAQDTIRHGQNPQRNKDRCPLGHLLVHPNLVPAALPWRRCLTCSRINSLINKRQKRGIPFPDISGTRDAVYRAIMGEAA